jgi:hypothetical protein
VTIATGTATGLVAVACIDPAGDCREIDTCCPDGTLNCFLTASDGGTDGGDSGPSPSCIPTEDDAGVADTCGVFVSSSKGSDTTGKGTKEEPYQTLGTALTKANGQAVYACGETFTEAVTISASVTLYGALMCSQSWAYDATQKTMLTAAAGAIPLRLGSGAGGTLVHDFAITAVDATTAGGASIAVLDDGAGVTLENVNLTAGNGAAGAGGAPQTAVTTAAMANGSDGGADATCNSTGVFGGAGGKNTCSGTDTGGGAGGEGLAAASGNPGGGGNPMMTPSNAGSGQTMSATCSAGQTGGTGGTGASGTGARGIGDVSSMGYIGAIGVLGGTGGPGQGGGGGGGALACDSPTDMFAGPSGGGGGAGGCGGGPGNPGQSGGSSIGLLALGVTPVLMTVSITTHAGGAGGTGGNGQPGSAGGTPGNPGGTGACGGGSGGPGGTGGPGGGGAGGHSVAVALKGTTLPDLSNSKITLGSGGAGGPGGDMNTTAQTLGDAGMACKTLDFTNPGSMTACAM